MSMDATPSYIVRLRRNATGQVVEHREHGEYDETAEYMWEGGNYGCDCNRSSFFEDAGGDLGDDDGRCGESRFTAIEAVLPDGRRIPMDSDEAARDR